MAKLNAAKQTLFMGEMLRTSLLNAYAWWTVGVFAGYAAWGLLIATLAVFGAFAFELLFAPRIEKRTVLTVKDARAVA
ncbi:MAG: hypothetical protein E6J29_07980 [Chloroflexi bacterium]|nr:MAG: hypothetical protein E6J29_07980 [Chloroflexota bacterium]